ncbi:MAG TPA: RNA 2',3'-cyclic phosphodiesterase [Candidatus Dormibacteraeota bacterium]
MPADDAERWRAFIAVALPQGVQDALAEPLRDLQPLSTWIRPNVADRIHLTLHFLGNIDPGVKDELVDQIRPIAAGTHPFSLAIEGVGAFPQVKRPKVLWAGVKGSGLSDLIRLQREIGSELARMGYTVEPGFTPHLTLGRVRNPLRREGRQAFDAWYRRWQSTTFGEFTVDGVHLMRSQLGGGPPRYTTLATFALQ